METQENIESLKQFIKENMTAVVTKSYDVATTDATENEMCVSEDNTQVDLPKTVNPLPSINIDDHSSVLKNQLEIILNVIDLAKEKAESSPSGRNVYPLTTLVQTAQALITDINRLKNQDQQVNLLLEKVIQPAFKALLKALTLEMHKALEEINKHVDTSKGKIVDHAINEALRGFGTQANIIYDEIGGKVLDILNNNLPEFSDTNFNRKLDI